MKITKIERKDNIFIIYKKPNFFEKIFGISNKIEKYKEIGIYEHFIDKTAYRNQNGKILGPFNKITNILDNWKHKF